MNHLNASFSSIFINLLNYNGGVRGWDILIDPYALCHIMVNLYIPFFTNIRIFRSRVFLLNIFSRTVWPDGYIIF